MSSNHPKSGVNNVGAYQITGIPFVTSSIASEVQSPCSNAVSVPTKITFPNVTNFITVRNTGINELRVGFASDGVVAPGERRATLNADKGGAGGRNYFLIPSASERTQTAGPAMDSSGTTQTFEVRCKEIHFLSNAAKNTSPTNAAVSTSFSLIAGLTTVEATNFPTLTGSNGFTYVG